MAEFLLEILSEEIPARMQARAAADLAQLVGDGLKAGGLHSDGLRTYVTPRRLVLVAEGLPVATPDVSEERRGPRVGAPEAALDGFLKSTGLALDQLETRDTGKGEFYFAVIAKKGRATADLLTQVVEAAMAAFPWPKSMRWSNHAVRWVRPIQSMVALFNGDVVPLSFGPVSAGAISRGHRFLAPDAFTVADFADYAAKLAAAKVILDPVERRHAIRAQAEAVAADHGLTLKADEGLLDEVTGLVEWPVVLMGSIDDRFMVVPPEVLSTSMRTHQKYFSLLRSDGTLAPKFLVVANMEAKDKGEAIIHGNQRVLRARLSDAAFFWDQDRKHDLDERVVNLSGRLFYQGLGSMGDKALRIATLSAHVAGVIDADVRDAARAGRLCKADLSSDMVGEFPELQGIMGRYYARHFGESETVANAIADHYIPAGQGDRVPIHPVSVAVALADRIDTLVGFFGIDEKPTGSKDPFALRRAALGVIRLIVENGIRLPLLTAFSRAQTLYPSLPREPSADLLEFFIDRLKVHLREKGIRHDLISAVVGQGVEDDLARLLDRVDALGAFLSTDDGANLLAAYRRAMNIVRIEEKKDGHPVSGGVDPALMEKPEEQALSQALVGVEAQVTEALQSEDFIGAMAALARLREPVDLFFQAVTVNAEDQGLRRNRLTLLAEIGRVMGGIADFSAIEG